MDADEVGNEIGDEDTTVTDLSELFRAERCDWMKRVVNIAGLRIGLVEVIPVVPGISSFKLLTSTGYYFILERVPYTELLL